MIRRRKSFLWIVLFAIVLVWSQQYNGKDIKVENVIESIGSIANVTSDTLKSYGQSNANQIADSIFNANASVNNDVLNKVSFVRVVDGDTIVVIDNGEEKKIRLLSVNTPESVSSDESKNNIYGEMASEFTKDYFKGVQNVWLQYDTEQTDKYGRTLAYVWMKEDIDINSEKDIEKYMYNALLVSNGQAKVVIYEPNHRYKDELLKLQDNVETNGIGLWQYAEFVNL